MRNPIHLLTVTCTFGYILITVNGYILLTTQLRSAICKSFAKGNFEKQAIVNRLNLVR